DDPAIDRLERIGRDHLERQRVSKRRIDLGRLRRAAGYGLEREPLALERTNVDMHETWLTALVGGGGAGTRPAPNGAATWQPRHREGGPAVAGERSEQRIDGRFVGADLVALAPVADARKAASDTDKVVRARRVHRAEDVEIEVVARDDRIRQRRD